MRARTHLIAASVLVVGVAQSVDPASVIPVSAGMFLGALLPDLDHHNSTISRSPIAALGVMVRALVSHRGFLHSLAGLLLVVFFGGTLITAIVGPWGVWLTAGVFYGYASHLLLDALTPSGVPLLWPLRLRVGVPLVTTGSTGEMVFAIVLLVFMVSAALA